MNYVTNYIIKNTFLTYCNCFVFGLMFLVFLLSFNPYAKAEPSFWIHGYGNSVETKINKKIIINKSNKRYKKKINKKVPRSSLISFRGHKMPSKIYMKLKEVESIFGRVKILSSCRPGATVKKTGRPSMHRYCRAVDFYPPRGKYRQVVNYLKTSWGGGVGTYSGRHNHIHIDDNKGRWHN